MSEKLLTFCTDCGYKLGRSGHGTSTEMICPKCHAQIKYEVSQQTVIIHLVAASTKKKKTPAMKS